MVVSSGEDVATAGLLALSLANPVAAIFLAIAMGAGTLYALIKVRSLLKRVFGSQD